MASLEEGPVSRPPRPKSVLRKLLRFVVTLLVLAVALGGSAFLVYSSWLRSHEPYTTALRLARQDPKLIEKLGQPIKEAFPWLPSVQGDEKQATIVFKLAGPKGTAGISADARRDKKGWYLQTLTAFPGDGAPRIVLDTGNEEGDDNAPPWWPATPVAPAPTKATSEPPAPASTPARPSAGPGEIKMDVPGLELPSEPGGKPAADAAKSR